MEATSDPPCDALATEFPADAKAALLGRAHGAAKATWPDRDVRPSPDITDEAKLRVIRDRFGPSPPDESISALEAALADPRKWWVDLDPFGGPVLGPFDSEGDAVEQKRNWLDEESLQSSVGDRTATPIRGPCDEILADPERCAVTWAGRAYGVSRVQALILDFLQQERGLWLSSARMGDMHSELKDLRIDRHLKKLHVELRAHVEGRSGKGYRWTANSA